jgi:predicted dehydrogenase
MGVTRRKFIHDCTGVTAITLLSPIHGSALQSPASHAKIMGANDRVRIGVIGCGQIGQKHLAGLSELDNVECAALCDVDDNQVAKSLRILERCGKSLPQVRTQDFRVILELQNIDAVIVCTPDHWHALTSIMACQAEKDVYLENPVSLTFTEGNAILKAARKHNRIVQVGLQHRSAPHFQEAVDYLKRGELGKIRQVRAWAYLNWLGKLPIVPDERPPFFVNYDMWLGPAPQRPFNMNRFHFSFRWFWDYSGGVMTEWGGRLLDLVRWGMDFYAPLSVASGGGKFGFPDDARETPDTQQALLTFPDFSIIWEHAIGLGRGPEGRPGGVSFHGVQGTLILDHEGWEVIPETERSGKNKIHYKSTGMPLQQAAGDAHLLHLKNFIDCVRSRDIPNADIGIGHKSLLAAHLANLSYRLNRRLFWDSDNEEIIADDEANKYLSHHYRPPWRLPE